jgi:hypothetical protein
MTPVEDVILDELGRLTTSGFPVTGFSLSVTTGGVFILAALAVVGNGTVLS